MELPITEILTLVVAISALWFTAKQFSIQREHNKLSVRPHLVLESRWKESRRYAFLKNVGLGPAEFTDHKVTYKDQVIPFEIADHIEGFADDYIGGGFYSGGDSLEKGMVIAPGQSITVLVLYWHEQHEYINAKQTIIGVLENLNIEVEYLSFYNDKFEMKPRAFVNPNDYSLY